MENKQTNKAKNKTNNGPPANSKSRNYETFFLQCLLVPVITLTLILVPVIAIILVLIKGWVAWWPASESQHSSTCILRPFDCAEHISIRTVLWFSDPLTLQSTYKHQHSDAVILRPFDCAAKNGQKTTKNYFSCVSSIARLFYFCTECIRRVG